MTATGKKPVLWVYKKPFPSSTLPDPVVRFLSLAEARHGVPVTVFQRDDEKDPSKGLTLVYMVRNAAFPQVGLSVDYAALSTGFYFLSYATERVAPQNRRWLWIGAREVAEYELRAALGRIEDPREQHLMAEALRFCFLGVPERPTSLKEYRHDWPE